MATVETTRHLHAFFPALAGEPLRIDAPTVAGILGRMEALAPGLGFYLCDERGRLRTHVNIFVDGSPVADRQALGDPVAADSRVFIVQALSGG